MMTHENTVVERCPSDLDGLEQLWYRGSIGLGVECCTRRRDLCRSKVRDGRCGFVSWGLHVKEYKFCAEAFHVCQVIYTND
jgi:hypothetical protein